MDLSLLPKVKNTLNGTQWQAYLHERSVEISCFLIYKEIERRFLTPRGEGVLPFKGFGRAASQGMFFGIFVLDRVFSWQIS